MLLCDDENMSGRIALTGGIASGKSTVADMLAKRGAVVIDADEIVRQLQRPGEPVLDAMVGHFGSDILHSDGTLNRPALGAIVFSDDEARATLNAIVHPAVRRRAAELEAATAPNTVIVHVIPLLVETGQAHLFDRVVVVDVPVESQQARLQARSGLSVEQAQARIAAQASRAERLAIATDVIDNSGSVAALQSQVDSLWALLR